MSNHPVSIKNNQPKMIEKRISELSSNREKFIESKGPYEEALKRSSFQGTLNYTEPTSDTKKKKRRKRNVIWFTPPYSQLTKTNIGKKFLQLLDSHFYVGHPLRKLFNRRTVKVSFSTLPNVGQIIKAHNKRVLKNSQAISHNERPCNCKRTSECPLQQKCLQKGVIYEAEVTSETGTYSYVGLTENHFKTRYNAHQSSFRRENARKSTELSKHIWNLKDSDSAFTIQWKVIDRGHPPSGPTASCDLCTTEKMHILENSKRTDIIPLNRRSEIVGKCRHTRKFMLMKSLMKE